MKSHCSIGTVIELEAMFRKLRTSELPVSPHNLIRSFGWTGAQMFETQDVVEMWRVMTEKLDTNSASNTLKLLLCGSYVLQYHLSLREEEFWGEYAHPRSLKVSSTSAADLKVDGKYGNLIESLQVACDKFNKSPEARIAEFRHLPPVLILTPWFMEYDLNQDRLIVVR